MIACLHSDNHGAVHQAIHIETVAYYIWVLWKWHWLVHWRCKFSLVRKKCIGISVVLTQSYLLICSLEGICKAVEEDLGAVLTAAVHHAAVTQFALTHFTRVRLRRARQPDSGCTDDANENETLTNQAGCGHAGMGKFSLPVTRHGTEKKETHRRTPKHILRKQPQRESWVRGREREKREERNKSLSGLLGSFHKCISLRAFEAQITCLH